MAEESEAKRIKEAYKLAILDKPNVLGVGIGYKVSGGRRTDELCVVTLVEKKMPPAGLAIEDLVPRELEGVATDVVEVGLLRALQERTDRWRPAPGGVSIGHFQITAGTLGAVVRDRTTGERLILSNNHVIANSNDANPGDPILQPGPADGGQVEADTLAQLVRFCPISFSTSPGDCALAESFASIGNTIAQILGSKHRLQPFQSNPAATNQVDGAVARPLSDAEILDEILEIGTVEGSVPASLGMPVRKSGRTTGLSTGQVTVLDATVDISYGAGRSARFENQIVTTAMSQGGDSGSLLVSEESIRAVGLLFAGSTQTTVHNPIQDVLDCLEVDI